MQQNLEPLFSTVGMLTVTAGVLIGLLKCPKRCAARQSPQSSWRTVYALSGAPLGLIALMFFLLSLVCIRELLLVPPANVFFILAGVVGGALGWYCSTTPSPHGHDPAGFDHRIGHLK